MQENDFKSEVSQLCFLAFVPLKDVEDSFDELYEALSDEGKQLATYFEEYFIRGNFCSLSVLLCNFISNETCPGRILRRQRGGDVRGNVRFPMDRWNCYQLVLNGCPKTNNIQEGNSFYINKNLLRSKNGLFKMQFIILD